jgi:hypothetical protein
VDDDLVVEGNGLVSLAHRLVRPSLGLVHLVPVLCLSHLDLFREDDDLVVEGDALVSEDNVLFVEHHVLVFEDPVLVLHASVLVVGVCGLSLDDYDVVVEDEDLVIEREAECIEHEAGCIEDQAGCSEEVAAYLEEKAVVLEAKAGWLAAAPGCPTELLGCSTLPDHWNTQLGICRNDVFGSRDDFLSCSQAAFRSVSIAGGVETGNAKGCMRDLSSASEEARAAHPQVWLPLQVPLQQSDACVQARPVA